MCQECQENTNVKINLHLLIYMIVKNVSEINATPNRVGKVKKLCHGLLEGGRVLHN